LKEVQQVFMSQMLQALSGHFSSCWG